MNNRCLARLEELELENERLNKEVNYLKDLVSELMIENRDLGRLNEELRR